MFIQNYKSMPHVFLLFEAHPSTKTCYEQITRFVLAVIGDKEIATRMEIVNGLGRVEEETVDLVGYTVEMEEMDVCTLTASAANH